MSTVIVMSGVYGGEAAGDLVRPIGNELKTRFRRLDAPYSDELEQLRINLFVSGSVTRFEGLSGWSNIRVMRRAGYVSFDLTLQPDVLASGTEGVWDAFRTFIPDAARAVDAKLKAKKIDFDGDRLVQDLAAVVRPG